MAKFGDSVASVSIFDDLTKGVWNLDDIEVLKQYGVVGTTGVWNSCQNNGISNFQPVLGQLGRPKFIWHSYAGEAVVRIGCDYNQGPYAFLTNTGRLFTWGNNAAGTGRSTNTNVPIAMDESGWIDMATGNFFMLGVKSDGTLWSWGRNDNGKTGRGVANTSVSSVGQIGTDTDWVQVACGYENGYALKSNGDLYAWGQSAHTGLNLTTGSTLTPTLVTSAQGLGTITHMSATSSHVGIVADGKLYTAGSPGNYGLGNGNNTTYHYVFTQVGTDTDWAWINYSAPYVFVAGKTNGHVYGWSSAPTSNNTFGSGNSPKSPTRVAITTGPAGAQGVFVSAHPVGTNHSFVGCAFVSGIDNQVYFLGNLGSVNAIPFPVQIAANTVIGSGHNGLMFGANP